MQQIVLFALLGLGTGALTAGVALSLVTMYRGSGVINLAAGAIVMITGFMFWALRTGKLGPTFGAAPALALTLVFAVIIGVVLELCTIRPLRSSTPLAKMVASLGVLLTAQGLVLLIVGPNTQQAPSILPLSTVSVFGVTVGVAHFILAGIVIASALALAAAYRWTKFGLATKAAAENEASAMLVGLSPNTLSLINVVIGTVIATLLGVLAASLIQLDTNELPLIVVPALAAAIFARFTSFTIACFAGLALGMAENLLYYLSTLSWFPTSGGEAFPGIEQLLIFGAIIVALFWRGARLPGRGDIVERRLPIAPRPERLARPAIIAAVVGVIALIVLPYNYRQALMNSMIGTVLALSMVIITGFGGQISVMQLALSGLSGILLAHLASGAGIGFPLGALIAAAGATVVGFGTAVAALRVRGVTLAVVTLAAAYAIEQFVLDNSQFGAGQGGLPVPQPTLAGFNLGNNAAFKGIDGHFPSPVLGFVILAVTILMCLFVANLRRSGFGLRMLAVRANERAAAATGVSVRSVKLSGFSVGAFAAGLAGALFAYNYGSISAQPFGALAALSLIAFVYIGGITMVQGALFAGVLATAGLSQFVFQEWFGISGTWTLLFGGVTLIFNLVFFPDGVAGTNYQKKQAKRALKRSREQADAQAVRVGSSLAVASADVSRVPGSRRE
jgi:branched-chain amino acid transport system permease protein